MTKKPEDLLKAYKKEKDPKVKTRIHAVLLFLEDDIDVADIMKCSENSVHNWIRRFDEASTDGLRDLPRTGCRPKIPKEKFDDIMEHVIESDADPVALHQNIIDATGTSYSLCQIRRIMHRYGLSRRKMYINHASPASVRSWQRYLEKTRIPRLKEDKFMLVAADEAFFVQNNAVRYVWGKTGTRSVAAYSSNHASVSVFGCITEDGKQLFRTFTGRFKSKQFVECLDAMRRKFGCVAVLCDRWSVHMSNEVKEYLREHRDVKIINMPKGSPYLNVTEACWNRGKCDLLGSAIYETTAQMRQRVSKYYRTTVFAYLNLYKYLYRSPTKALKYL